MAREDFGLRHRGGKASSAGVRLGLGPAWRQRICVTRVLSMSAARLGLLLRPTAANLRATCAAFVETNSIRVPAAGDAILR